jgi:hypothetical protein
MQLAEFLPFFQAAPLPAKKTAGTAKPRRISRPRLKKNTFSYYSLQERIKTHGYTKKNGEIGASMLPRNVIFYNLCKLLHSLLRRPFGTSNIFMKHQFSIPAFLKASLICLGHKTDAIYTNMCFPF